MLELETKVMFGYLLKKRMWKEKNLGNFGNFFLENRNLIHIFVALNGNRKIKHGNFWRGNIKN